MYPPSKARKDSSSSAHPLLLPQPASSSSSSRLVSSRWTPPRRVVLLLLALGVSAALWSGSGRAEGLLGGREEQRGGVELSEVVEEPLYLQVDETPAEPEPTVPEIVFTPRLPCNALTTTTETLPSGDTQTWLSPSPPLPFSAPLSARLSSWLSSPIADPTTWQRFDRQTCGNPSVRRNANKVHVRENEKVWSETGEEKVRELRRELAGVLERAEEEGRLGEWEEEGKKGTRGIVWTAGNADTFDRVLVSLRLLRDSYGCTLPATVFHFPSESPSASQLSAFSSLGASVLPLSLSKDADPNRTKSFHLKGAALVEAPYDEVLMLDSDNVPVRDVSGLWDSPEFKAMGVVLWPDYWKDQPENAIWSILGVQCRDELTAEAGQLLIRKSQHLDALILVEHMLRNWKFWFQFSDGDKDLFRYALLALRKRWAIPSSPLAPASWTDPLALGRDHAAQFAGHTMVQYGLLSEQGGEQGRPLFVHANLLKRVLGSANKGNTWGRTLRLHLPSSLLSALSPVTLTSSSSSSDAPDTPDTPITSFVLEADHLLNPSPFTGLGALQQPFSLSSRSSSPSSSTSPVDATKAPIPFWLRAQSLLARGLSAHFWDGHRRSAYVLAVETEWRDELRSLYPSSSSSLPPAPGRNGEGEEGSEGRPWEAEEGMGEGEWTEWSEWVRREAAAECTREADVVMQGSGARAGAGAGEDGEDGKEEDNGQGAEPMSLRDALLSSSSGPSSSLPSAASPQSSSYSPSFDDWRSSPLSTVRSSSSFLQVDLWAEDADLKEFEERFYDVGRGKAGGPGFRRRMR
ncbi:hypothetical protein JCM6882_006924 [Rhodosporidiobolus microsporus]